MPFKETATPFFSNTFPSNLQVSFLAIHFSPIIIVAAPFYAIYPSTITLFVVGSSILAAGSIPVYYLAYERISSRLAAVSFQISYLVHPAILFSSLHGFLPEFFLAPLGVTCFYFLLKRKLIYFFLSSLLLASVIEEAGIIAIILAGTWLLVYRKSIKAKEFLALILVAATVAIYVKFAFYARVSVFGLDENGVTSLISKENWSILGASSALQVPSRLLECPACGLNALSYDIQGKISWAVTMLTPTLFMNFASLSSLLGFIPWSFVSFLSNYKGYYSVYAFESLFAISTIHLGSIVGLKKALSKSRRSTQIKYVCATMIIVTISVSSVGSASLGRYGYSFAITPHDLAKEKIISLIPANASVLAETDVFPHVANRFEAYRIPSVAIHGFYADVDKSILGAIKPEYVLVDTMSQIKEVSAQTSTILSSLIVNSSAYSVYAYADGIILFKKGQDKPLLLELVTNLNSTNLITSLPVVSTEEGKAIFKPPGFLTDTAWFGPYVYLPAGNYTATFLVRIETNQSTNSSLISLDVAYGAYEGGIKEISSIIVYPKNVTGNIQAIKLNFSLSKEAYDIELRGLRPDPGAAIYLYSIVISRD